MKPTIINWTATGANTAVVCSAATATQNVALLFANPVYVATATSIQPVVAYTMPPGIVRTLVVSAATGSVAGVSFSVVGLDQNGNSLVETLVGTTPGSRHFRTVLSITPTTAITATVNVGLGNAGSTLLTPMDVYNKNNNFTLAYNVQGTVSLAPFYTVNQVISFVETTQVVISTYTQNAALYYALPLANANFINSPPAVTTATISTTSSFSFVGIPMTGLLTIVGASTTAPFTQTIIQQGAAY